MRARQRGRKIVGVQRHASNSRLEQTARKARPPVREIAPNEPTEKPVSKSVEYTHDIESRSGQASVSERRWRRRWCRSGFRPRQRVLLCRNPHPPRHQLVGAFGLGARIDHRLVPPPARRFGAHPRRSLAPSHDGAARRAGCGRRLGTRAVFGDWGRRRDLRWPFPLPPRFARGEQQQ